MKRACLGLDDLDGQKALGDDRRTDPAMSRRAPVLRQRSEPLLVADEVAVAQELTEPYRLEGRV